MLDMQVLETTEDLFPYSFGSQVQKAKHVWKKSEQIITL